ncbi:hypothetical protein HUO13_31620 [Saccharopolyspora erythraea]|uniref:hypothetical protein n=1 Tax=Saccharopolyspora erythraea TaxID=1836 RepID=UPI001BAD103F|nr:hypothetical protein [Saccharopolyspora erythraea]QUH04720.1 hypothetical protein HUO13_31620 [Saccharopolyspora erythraea]
MSRFARAASAAAVFLAALAFQVAGASPAGADAQDCAEYVTGVAKNLTPEQTAEVEKGCKQGELDFRSCVATLEAVVPEHAAPACYRAVVFQ